MTSPPAVRPSSSSGSIRATGDLRPWELRSRDGRHPLGRVTQKQAEELVLQRRAEAVKGRHGWYLRAVVSANAEAAIGRFSGPPPTARPNLDFTEWKKGFRDPGEERCVLQPGKTPKNGRWAPLSLRKAAAVLNLSPETVMKLLSSGRLHGRERKMFGRTFWMVYQDFDFAEVLMLTKKARPAAPLAR